MAATVRAQPEASLNLRAGTLGNPLLRRTMPALH
jgi:hypothetical protein